MHCLRSRWVMWLVLLALPAGAVMAHDLDGNDRLLSNFARDGEVIPAGWVEARSEFQAWDKGDRAAVGALVAYTFASDFEVGASVAGMWVDPDDARSESGLADTVLFGKVRLMEKPVILSVGTQLSLPTGDEHDGTGTGEVDIEFFGAIRKPFRSVALVAHGGFRINQDTDVRLRPGGFPKDGRDGETEGEVSALLGVGAIFHAGARWGYQAELLFETERYEDHDSDLRLVPGVTFRTARTALRGGVAIGLTDGAPDYAALASAVFRF